ncbi:MAG TPA: hypothetical protein PLN21_18745 [Gemmatales bacterium]|nr:hypothetical protein [Gemmatales bacterium]
MQLLSPEVLADVLELPVAAMLVMVGLGMALALTGWRWHRFWLTICVSMVSGVVGLRQATAWGIEQPVLAGVLLAAAAGCLALSLARVGLFLAYGLVTWYAMKRLAPPYAIPAICICLGGLFSVLFYRFCVVLLTSLVGSLLLAYGGMAYAQLQNWFPMVTWLKEQPLAAHGAFAAVCGFTLFVQLYLWRRARRKKLPEYTAEELEAERRLGFAVKKKAA